MCGVASVSAASEHPETIRVGRKSESEDVTAWCVSERVNDSLTLRVQIQGVQVMSCIV